jgi:hypothetical protein
MANEKRSIVATGLFPDVMEALASGVCIGLNRPLGLGKPVMTVAMDIDGTERDANFSADSLTHYTLSDPSVVRTDPVDYSIEGVCQTCTLQMVLDTGVQILDRKPANVTVRRTRGCHGYDTIVIKAK